MRKDIPFQGLGGEKTASEAVLREDEGLTHSFIHKP
jgi:hypothetical protein